MAQPTGESRRRRSGAPFSRAPYRSFPHRRLISNCLRSAVAIESSSSLLLLLLFWLLLLLLSSGGSFVCGPPCRRANANGFEPSVMSFNGHKHTGLLLSFFPFLFFSFFSLSLGGPCFPPSLSLSLLLANKTLECGELDRRGMAERWPAQGGVVGDEVGAGGRRQSFSPRFRVLFPPSSPAAPVEGRTGYLR